MENGNRLAIGLDIGTTTVRVVVGQFDEDSSHTPTIIGTGSAASSGLRKGVVVNIVNTAHSIDKALEDAERMSGQQLNSAAISINGPQIVSLSSKGVVAVGGSHEIVADDLARAEEAAAVVQLPANRQILQITPRSYQLDGQSNIKDPLGMSGVRLEVDAQVITALTPHIKNLEKACEMTQTQPTQLVVAGVAAAKAVVTDSQAENGVVLIDIGGGTTNLAVYEEGDLQHVAIIPMGGINITNDLAIGLKTDLDIADAVKLQHAKTGTAKDKTDKTITVTVDGQKHTFKTKQVEMIVEARLEELFELVNKELKSIGRAAKLPGGAVLVGGSAKLAGLADFAKEALQLPARIGNIEDLSGVADAAKDPSFATAIGLMLLDLENHSPRVGAQHSEFDRPSAFGKGLKEASSKVSNFLKKFKA